METSQNGMLDSLRSYSDFIWIYLFYLRQNETPIYNLAAGTCLNVKVPKIGSIVTLDLCTESENNKWDLLKTAI